MKTVKVLSLDWDYFINASATEREVLFPDGGNENLPDAIKNYIWSTRYASGECNGKSLGDIKVDRMALAAIRNILRKIVNADTMVVVADSHKYAYDAILQVASGFPADIYNVDFHHDIYGWETGKLEEVDCGNWYWAWMASPEYNELSHCYWVAREDSQYSDNTNEVLTVIQGKEIPVDEPFDMVFLCRSGMWSPPHLDGYFTNLIKFIEGLKHKATSIPISTPVVKYLEAVMPRYTPEMKNLISEQRAMMAKCMEGMKADGIIEDSCEP